MITIIVSYSASPMLPNKIMAREGVMIVIIRVLTTIITTSFASLLVPC